MKSVFVLFYIIMYSILVKQVMRIKNLEFRNGYSTTLGETHTTNAFERSITIAFNQLNTIRRDHPTIPSINQSHSSNEQSYTSTNDKSTTTSYDSTNITSLLLPLVRQLLQVINHQLLQEIC